MYDNDNDNNNDDDDDNDNDNNNHDDNDDNSKLCLRRKDGSYSHQTLVKKVFTPARANRSALFSF